MQKELPVRKHPRLKAFNYSSDGAYFVTFCVKGKHEMLGKIVGRGILDAPLVQLSEYGKNIVGAIEFLNRKHDRMNIEKYVIMPNHVHFIVIVNDSGDGASGHNDDGASGKPRPTNELIPKLISSIKRFTNKKAGFDMWQTSYYDHIIRNESDYQRIWQYIDENPARWEEDDYFV